MVSDWSDERTTNNLTVSRGTPQRRQLRARLFIFILLQIDERRVRRGGRRYKTIYCTLVEYAPRTLARACVCDGDVAAQFVGLSKFNLAKVRLNSVRAHLASVFVCARPVFLRCGFYYYCHFFFFKRTRSIHAFIWIMEKSGICWNIGNAWVYLREQTFLFQYIYKINHTRTSLFKHT